MAKRIFRFGARMRGGDSLLKLLIYYENGTKDTPYSFDGRYHLQGGKARLTDDPKHWNIDNGRRYLQHLFQEDYAHRNLKYAAIVESDYPTMGVKLREYDFNSGEWTSPEAVNKQRHAAHIVQRDQKRTEQYAFRLSIPILKKTPHEDVKWKNLFTSTIDQGEALVNLIGQYVAWQKADPSVRPQSIGQFYGDGKKKYGLKDIAPRLAWFDAPNLKPRYHGTQRELESYQQLQNSYKNFEEMISNVMA